MKPAGIKGRESNYFRYYMWSNKWFARLIVLLAGGLQGVGRVLPARVRAQSDGFARLMRLLAQLIVQPTYVYRCMQWRPTLKGMLDGALLGGILGFWTAYYIDDKLAILNILALLFVLAVAVTFAVLSSFLFVSGDVYFGPVDEFQQAASHQAGADTLRITFVLFLILFIAYIIEPAWRNAVCFHLSTVYFISRISYLLRFTQLRWQEMADVEVMQDIEEDADVPAAREA